MVEFRQLTLFDPPERPTAVTNLMDGREEPVKDLESWMQAIVPSGEMVVMVGIHPMVLCPTALTKEEVRPEMRYCHYLADNTVYSGVFVGKETV